jgi:hypothetical protein
VGFGATTPLQIQIGGGAVIPPTVSVSCAGHPVPAPRITVSLVASTSDLVFFGSGASVWPAATTLVGSSQGVAKPPIISSELTTGSFELQASWDGVSASVPGAVTGTVAGTLPPQNPQYALAAGEDAGPDCSGVSDDSPICLRESEAFLNAGRMNEALGPLVLPSNWSELSVPDQLLVMTDLERTARGQAPFSGIAADLDSNAQSGANAGEDPSWGDEWWNPEYVQSANIPADGGPTPANVSYPGSGIADYGEPNAIMATFAWVYADGIFPDGRSGDADCTYSNQTDCWEHRDEILEDDADVTAADGQTNVDSYACELSCPIGAAYAPTGSQGAFPAYTELVPNVGNSNDPLVFSWASEVPSLPACEQQDDTCSWSGQPLATSSGFENVSPG